jgi:5'-3' exonuclease
MGIKGLYSALKSQSSAVNWKTEPPLQIGVDAYCILYKFREDVHRSFEFLMEIKKAGHGLVIVLDGTPPPEKDEEMLIRREARRAALEKATTLRSFLEKATTMEEITEEIKKEIQQKIIHFEKEGWSVRKEVRARFCQLLKDAMIPFIDAKGEADDLLIKMARQKKIDVVISNDMDIFVGGVERFWMVDKKSVVPQFREFNRTEVSNAVGINPQRWADVAILAGYEKCKGLKRVSAPIAISWIRFYGSLEGIYARRPELLGEGELREFVAARRFFAV